MMSAIGRNQDISGIKESDQETAGFKRIQPENTMSLQECKAFWENVLAGEPVDGLKMDVDPLKEKALDDSREREQPEKKGGSYGEVFREGEGDRYEVHHMPSDSVSDLDRNDGPAIKMEKDDHRLTASCGNSREAQEYRQMQRELIEKGKFREALQMDIDDIHDKFGDKYDEAIGEMMEYVDKLEKEGKIDD